ncbi:uncharacterized protein LY89DRAFT_782786 [Mollisia scopiformis]|uniref:RNA polymerase II subunit B1 CTD phosphatase RPAP2 homolog n=1 Tax=Mollisia scopiformis TaxID=149040 RepID=A0A194X9T8_MOLSC|nr:uncharacterized protein LY89DRAFT_782786 [Mollisia scopiformis]KUJ16542.1 hypothetical protein LY89DRAFT_782786 [Mollisia scopiformis]
MSSYPATSATSSKTKEERDREVALYHANLIQQRKDIELEILLSTETLIDYPLARSPYDASNPSPADAKTFKELLRPFQPSDYDALIVERNINEHCGYALCPNPRVKEEGGGRFRILGMNGKAKDFKVVEKEELEKWCSPACAKRALYVRVQLSETVAWERGAMENAANIDLLDEPKSEDGSLAERMEKMDIETDNAAGKKDAANLALERGDKTMAARNALVNINIQEKDVSKVPQAPSLDDKDLSGRLDSMHLTLEGHTSTFGSRRERRHNEELDGANIDDGEEDSEEDTDWQL